jgi:hypothetical protein
MDADSKSERQFENPMPSCPARALILTADLGCKSFDGCFEIVQATGQ